LFSRDAAFAECFLITRTPVKRPRVNEMIIAVIILGRTKSNPVVYAADRDESVEGVRTAGMGSGAVYRERRASSGRQGGRLDVANYLDFRGRGIPGSDTDPNISRRVYDKRRCVRGSRVLNKQSVASSKLRNPQGGIYSPDCGLNNLRCSVGV
jgi:hypothetical protein